VSRLTSDLTSSMEVYAASTERREEDLCSTKARLAEASAALASTREALAQAQARVVDSEAQLAALGKVRGRGRRVEGGGWRVGDCKGH
jgi:hypothetical protein